MVEGKPSGKDVFTHQPEEQGPGAPDHRRCAALRAIGRKAGWTSAVHHAIIFAVKMTATYTRHLPLPERSFFLFGPRGTGKTTWLRQELPSARWYDLIRDREVLRLTRDTAVFAQEVQTLPRGSWVVIDEVQRLPALLNEIQDLIARHGHRVHFALTGSSARRLKREQANLLAMRLVNRQFFPLTAAELGGDFVVESALRFGTLPAVTTARTNAERTDLLEAYAANYLTQEIRAEALVRRLDSFTRFLDVAALANGQVTSLAGIARDAAVARPTVQGYFEVLTDTLIGTFLPAWRTRAKVKEVAHPKFYFFDPGVVRALTGRLHEPLHESERGALLETFVLGELRAWLNLSVTGGRLAFWRTPSGSEIDFVWSRGSRAVGIEVKASERWRSGDGRALQDLLAKRVIQRGFGVYLGNSALRDGSVDVLPLKSFLAKLNDGAVLG
jgi:predicted AAA+ superfamily ATPase